MELLSDDELKTIGAKVIQILRLKRRKDGYYRTDFGRKNELGIGTIVYNIIHEKLL